MSAIVLGSEEAKKVIEENKRLEAMALMNEIDWEKIAENASSWTETTAEADFEWRGEKFFASYQGDCDEDHAIDGVIDKLKEKVEQAIKSGRIKDEKTTVVPPDQISLLGD